MVNMGDLKYGKNGTIPMPICVCQIIKGKLVFVYIFVYVKL